MRNLIVLEYITLDGVIQAAGGKDIMLLGGADVAQQYLKAGLLDEIHLHLMPVLLGEGI
jgi:dihydrofolate reductase